MRFKFIVAILLMASFSTIFAQKDCTLDHLGNIPITDLGADYFNGMQGGLYPGGSNSRPPDHLTQCITNVTQIEPLDIYGNPDAAGKVVMLGIGASNPLTEFQRLIEFTDDFEPANDNLEMVNACVGGEGIQKMYNITDNYWSGVVNKLEILGLSLNQVQVIWIEQDNTRAFDTVFPSAPSGLVDDFRLLLNVIHNLFPNVQICYVTARAYSGYATPIDPEISGGLLYPRDYYNGWAVKFLVEKIINHAPGFETTGPAAQLPLVTWGTYHWTDGSTPRIDGLFLDCEEDVAPDGLHLTGPGEFKMGQLMFDYFKTDTTAKYWYYDKELVGINTNSSSAGQMQINPNPIVGNNLSINLHDFGSNELIQFTVSNSTGMLVFDDHQYVNEQITLNIPQLAAGIYYVTAKANSGIATSRFFVTR